MKIRLVGAEFFDADGRTDGQAGMTKLIVAFGNFANASKHSVTSFVPIKCTFIVLVQLQSVVTPELVSKKSRYLTR
jgi:hypothetical protein